MKTFESKTFNRGSFSDQRSSAVFDGFQFNRCRFQGYSFSATHDPALRSTIRNVAIRDCFEVGCTIYTPIIEDLTIDGLETSEQLLRSHGAVFNRVMLRGKIGRLMLSNDPLPPVLSDDASQQREIETFREANAKYYKSVDWALNISNGEFKELSIRGIPASLIRRDPETQIVVTRESALRGTWKKLKFQSNLFPTSLQLFLDRNEKSLVLVAAKRHAAFRSRLEDLALLRKADISEPD